MKPLLYILFLLLLTSACRNGPAKRFKPYTNELDAVFQAGLSKVWSNRRFKPEDVFDSNSPAYKKLAAAGILNTNSQIIFSAPDCVSILNSKHLESLYIEQKRIVDTIIMFNGNEGKFACGINDIYTMNQDESIGSLHISVYKIDAATNVFIVTN